MDGVGVWPVEAQPLYEHALAILKRTLGSQHEKTIAVRTALSSVLDMKLDSKSM
jgi:hypothetical protein